MSAEIRQSCNTVEECYEFMLAYAAQGLPTDEGSQSGGQLREFLPQEVRQIAKHFAIDFQARPLHLIKQRRQRQLDLCVDRFESLFQNAFVQNARGL